MCVHPLACGFFVRRSQKRCSGCNINEQIRGLCNYQIFFLLQQKGVYQPLAFIQVKAPYSKRIKVVWSVGSSESNGFSAHHSVTPLVHGSNREGAGGGGGVRWRGATDGEKKHKLTSGTVPHCSPRTVSIVSKVFKCNWNWPNQIKPAPFIKHHHRSLGQSWNVTDRIR